MFRFMSFTVLIAMILLLNCNIALANGMPYNQSPGQASGTIIPSTNENVELIEEELIINFKSKKRSMINNPEVNAEVQAKYIMINRIDSELEIPVAFPQPGEPSDWTVTLDGKQLSLIDNEKSVEKKSIGIDYKQLKWVDPFTGESYLPEDNLGRQMETNSKIQATTFILPLKPGKHQLLVSVQTRPGVDEKRNLNPVYCFQYLLRPAAYWNDFKNLHITLQIPFDHRLQSSLPLQQTGQYTWQGKFNRLPEDDLLIFFSAISGTWGGLINSRPAALSILIVLIVILILLRIYLFPKMKANVCLVFNVALSLFIIWSGYNIFSRQIFPYPFNFIQYLLFGLLLVWLLLVPWIRLGFNRKD